MSSSIILGKVLPHAIAFGAASTVIKHSNDGANTLSHALDLGQSFAAAVVGISILGPSATAYAGFGLLVGAHAGAKYLCAYNSREASTLKNEMKNVLSSANISENQKTLNRYRSDARTYTKIDNMLSFVASGINLYGYYAAFKGAALAMSLGRQRLLCGLACVTFMARTFSILRG